MVDHPLVGAVHIHQGVAAPLVGLQGVGAVPYVAPQGVGAAFPLVAPQGVAGPLVVHQGVAEPLVAPPGVVGPLVDHPGVAVPLADPQVEVGPPSQIQQGAVVHNSQGVVALPSPQAVVVL